MGRYLRTNKGRTLSPSAAFEEALRCCEEVNAIDRRITGFMLPFGSDVNLFYSPVLRHATELEQVNHACVSHTLVISQDATCHMFCETVQTKNLGKRDTEK